MEDSKAFTFRKFNARERINLSKNGVNMNTEKGTADVFNNFFGNIVKNLNISQYSDFDPIIENIKDATLTVILKYKKHPSILAIRTTSNRNGVFSFRKVSFKKIETKIMLLKLNKASQYSDISTKIIEKNSDIFSDFICKSINNFIKSSIFSSCLKHADVTSLHEKCNKSLKENYRSVKVYFQFYQMYLKEVFLSKYQVFLVTYFQIPVWLQKKI